MKVLLVEDDDSIRALIADVLVNDREYDVVACASATEAWEICSQEQFALAIVDWMLPGMDGLELCRRLRATEHGRATIILVITARSQPDDLVTVLDAGADDYLAKPLDMSMLDIRLTIAERRAEEVRKRLEAELVAKQAARLDGVLLAARTAAHQINNILSIPVGYAELLTLEPAIGSDPALLHQVIEIRDQTQRAAEVLHRLQRVIRLEETPTTGDYDHTVLDIDRSTAG